MFGFSVSKTTESQDTTKIYGSSRVSTDPVKSNETKSGESTGSKRVDQKKVEYEQLKERLAKEKDELERTQQEVSEDQRYEWEDNFVDDPLTHQLNLAFIATTVDYQTGHRYRQVKGSFNAASINFNKNNNAISFDSFAQKGLKYSSAKGQKLAKDVANHSVGFTGKCSKYVRTALQRTGMHNGHTASAYQMGGVLGKNKNFQEIDPSTVNLKQLPAGCILVYDKGAAGYSSKHGHIEVTLGDGTACSDGRTHNLRSTQNMRIFVPVEQA